MTSLVLLEQNGWMNTRGSYSHGGKHRFIAMAHSNSNMNIDEAVSDIRRTSLSLCWTLPLLFSTKKVQIPTRTLTLTNIRKTKID
jgi:hypothetical protein